MSLSQARVDVNERNARAGRSVTQSVVPFLLQNIWVAVPAGHVREVLGERSWLQVPSTVPHIPGLVAWQGRAIALLDLGAFGAGMRPIKPNERRRRTLVVHVDGATLAVPVDSVSEAEEVLPSSLRAAQATRLEHCSQEVELRGIPMPLLNLREAMKVIFTQPQLQPVSG